MDRLSTPAAKLLIGLGAAVALLLIAAKVFAKPKPGELETGGPESAPPIDQLDADWISPINGSAVDVPFVDIPFGPQRVVPFTVRIRNRGASSLRFTPEIRLASETFSTVNNTAFDQQELGPGESRLVSGELRLETPPTVLGQTLTAELHARLVVAGVVRDTVLSRVTFFTQ